MIQFLVNRPIAVMVSFFALMLLGLTAFWHIPASLLPDMDVPEINVSINAADYASKELEQRLTYPLRSHLQQLKGLRQIESTSSEGKGKIMLSFEHGTNTSLAFIEVNEKVDMAMNELPRDIQRPLVSKASISNIPAFYLNVYPKDNSISDARFIELSNFSREVIRRRLEQLPEVAMVDLTGMLIPQVQITPKSNILNTLNVSNFQLITALQEHEITLGNILVKDGQYQYFLNFSSGLYDVKDIAAIPLNINKRLFSLSDLAFVTMGHNEVKGAFSANGRRALNFAVIKQPSAKMDDLKEKFDRLLHQMRLDYPDLTFEITQDQTSLLSYAISNLQQDLLLGGILAFIFMIVFIRKWRPAMLIGISIPVSLIITQLGFYLMGISLNIISLGGLILGLGMVIDNSIVVIDTITSHREKGEPTTEAVINGTNEIIRPLITSMLTNCAVFIPMIFMNGLTGALFYDQALSITIGVVSSLLVSIIFLPPLYDLVYRKMGLHEKMLKSNFDITSWYEQGLNLTFRFPILIFSGVILFSFAGVITFNFLKKEQLAPISRNDLEVKIDWNENINLKTSEQRIKKLFLDKKTIIEENTWIGEQQYLMTSGEQLSYNQAKLYLKVRDKSQLWPLQNQLATAFAKRFPNAIIQFYPAKNALEILFSSEMAPLRIKASAVDKQKMPSEEQMLILNDQLIRALPSANINPVPIHNKLIMKVDFLKTALYDVNTEAIYAILKNVLKSTFVENYQGAQSLVQIVLTNSPVKSVNNMLANTFVTNNQQEKIRLSQLIDVRWEKEYQNITAGIAGEYYPVDIITNHPERDLPKIKEILAKNNKEVTTSLTGSYYENRKLLIDMMLILAVSILLLYFVLAAQFESLIQPLFILTEIPIAISGSILLLYVTGNSLNLMSMIGIIIMCGLIINDSILKIDAINQLRKQGLQLMTAISEGGHRRLKPIVMINLTSLGTLLPTLFMKDMGSELQKPLALALIGGMLSGMLISLFFVPLLYSMTYKRGAKPKLK